jgi:hypothetical protein
MRPAVRLLATRLLAALALPSAGCWVVDTRSEVLSVSPGPDGVCRGREDPELSLYVPKGSRCSPDRLESIDDGPLPEHTPDGKLRCLYLVTISRTQRPEICISGGRPLRIAGQPTAAPLLAGGAWG